tara:strand:- start:5103 stop:5354 length:252 start_codon:yes stop_codon:yes gene_type:complete
MKTQPTAKPSIKGQSCLDIRFLRKIKNKFETCRECGGGMKVIACIEDSVVIKVILNHLKEKGGYQSAFRLPESRGSPQTSLFG